MPELPITQAEVDSLLHTGNLAVSGEFDWTPKDNMSWVKIEIPVSSTHNHSFRLVLSASRQLRTKYQFALIMNSKYRIRGLCAHTSHTNKHTNDNRWNLQLHLHRWTDRCADRFVYEPTSIRAADLGGQLVEFLSECKISGSLKLGALPETQGDLFSDV